MQTEAIPYRHEVVRKSIHLQTWLIAIAIWFFPAEYVVPVLIAWGILVPILDLLRIRFPILSRYFMLFFGKILRPSEEKNFTGATWLALAIALLVAFFPKETTVFAITALCVGDSVAAVVGRKIGNTKIGKKSLEGSLAFIISTLIIVIWLQDLPIFVLLSGSIFSAIIELLPVGRWNDNFTVPVLTAIFIESTRTIL